MKISTKGRYALRLMLDLAVYNTGEPISLKDVAKRQNISEKYMEQIISVLNKAGFVRGIRGAQGGYLLSRAPKDYTVGMILRLTEGELAPVACVGQNPIDCERRSSVLVDVSDKAVSKWENGESEPSIDKLIKLSKYFGVNIDESMSFR